MKDYLFNDEKHQANFGGIAEQANKYEAILYKIKPILKANQTFKLYGTFIAFANCIFFV